MPPNLRVSLTIFSIGFAMETGVDVYHLVTGSTKLLAGGTLFLIGAVATVLGLVFLFLGRHEWNELHRDRVRHAHVAFLVVVLLGLAAALPPAYYATHPSSPPPSWLGPEVGAAVAASLYVTFILYILIVYHLVRRPGQAAAIATLVAAVPVCYFVGAAVAANMSNYLASVPNGPNGALGLVQPVVSLLSWFFLAYALLLVAFVDAHHRVTLGLTPTLA